MCGVVCCGVVCCVELCCGVLCGVGVVWCGALCCVVLCCCVVWCGVVWCVMVWCGMVWWCGVVLVWCGFSVVWCGVVWCGAHVMSLQLYNFVKSNGIIFTYFLADPFKDQSEEGIVLTDDLVTAKNNGHKVSCWCLIGYHVRLESHGMRQDGGIHFHCSLVAMSKTMELISIHLAD